MCIETINLGLRPYQEVWDLQHSLFDAMVSQKKRGIKPDKEYLLLVEHTPVITLGKHAKESNLLVSDSIRTEKNIDCFRIERGGDVTYHGPGQLVAYPILDLERHNIGVKDYVNLLEESVIQTIRQYGIAGNRIEGASGVWIGTDCSAKKICALGVKCSRFCTMHGLALNVNTDLSAFSMINPCGFTDRGVTSMAAETGRDMDFEDVKKRFSEILLRLILSL